MYSVHVSVQCTVFMSVNVTEINPNLTQDGALIDICKNNTYFMYSLYVQQCIRMKGIVLIINYPGL